MIATLHWICATLALVLGGVQLAATKGTPAHRRLGWTYAGLLLVVNATALVTYRETGAWNQFHWLAVLSLATLLVALGGFALFGRRWWISHAYVSAPGRTSAWRSPDCFSSRLICRCAPRPSARHGW
jgi:uncharacterized membrane protein